MWTDTEQNRAEWCRKEWRTDIFIGSPPPLLFPALPCSPLLSPALPCWELDRICGHQVSGTTPRSSSFFHPCAIIIVNPQKHWLALFIFVSVYGLKQIVWSKWAPLDNCWSLLRHVTLPKPSQCLLLSIWQTLACPPNLTTVFIPTHWNLLSLNPTLPLLPSVSSIRAAPSFWYIGPIALSSFQHLPTRLMLSWNNFTHCRWIDCNKCWNNPDSTICIWVQVWHLCLPYSQPAASMC